MYSMLLFIRWCAYCRCVYTQLLKWLWLWFGPTLKPRLQFLFVYIQGVVVVEGWIWPYSLSLLLMQSVEWRQTIYGFLWKVCLEVIAFYKCSPMVRPWSSLLVPHNNCKQNRTKESESQSLQLLPTTPCITVGQGTVVVVVVVTGHQCTSSILFPKN